MNYQRVKDNDVIWGVLGCLAILAGVGVVSVIGFIIYLLTE